MFADIVIKVAPTILTFFLGFFLKKARVFTKENADLFLRLVFFVASPALILWSVPRVPLSLGSAYLPMSAVFIVGIVFVVSFGIARVLNLSRPSQGTFLVGTMVMNTAFTLPFIFAVLGEEGFVHMMIFDLGNTFLVLTAAYFVACLYGGRAGSAGRALRKAVSSPPLWALLISILINLFGVRIPAVATSLFQSIGNLALPLITLSLGIYFEPRIERPFPVISAVLVRSLVGLAIGWGISYFFSLQGLDKLIVLIGSSAPVGLITLTFASLENLDKELAAQMLSLSLLLALCYIPILLMVFGI